MFVTPVPGGSGWHNRPQAFRGFPEQFSHVGSCWGTHSTKNQSHHRTSIYEGERVSPLLTSHYTEVPSGATARGGHAAPLAAAAARGRDVEQSGQTPGFTREPAHRTETPVAPQELASEKQWDRLTRGPRLLAGCR